MIAVPITAKKIEDAFEEIEEANKKADAIELRLDYLDKVNENELKKLIEACDKKVIVTARPKREGGFFKGTEIKRISLLINAAKIGADFVDIEASTNSKLITKLIKNRKTARIILSYHNFKETPHFDELKKVFDKLAKKKGVSVVKIVTYARTMLDNEMCFMLIKHAKSQGKRIICFSMGIFGRDSRTLSVFFGAYMTFASLEKGKESADGQMTVDEMKRTYNGLSVMF